MTSVRYKLLEEHRLKMKNAKETNEMWNAKLFDINQKLHEERERANITFQKKSTPNTFKLLERIKTQRKILDILENERLEL
jgi:hypothetical protein